MSNLAVKNFFGKAGLWTKQHSPELCIVGMIGCGIAAMIAAGKETLKVDEILEEHSKKMDDIHKTREEHPDEYPEETMQRDTCIVYAKTAGQVLKTYAPAIGLFAASMAFGCASFGIMKKRNAEIAATAASTLSLFKDYRQRVVDKYGAEVDQELRYGVQKTVEEEKTITDENGKEKKVKEKYSLEPGTEDYVTRYFVKGNPNWSANPEYRNMFVDSQISYLKNILDSRGFLNEIEAWDAFGIDINVHNNDSDSRKLMLASASGKGWGRGVERKTDIIDYEEVRIPDEFGNYQPAIRIMFHIDGDLSDVMSKRKEIAA